MDKSWMKIQNKLSKEYLCGVDSFIEHAKNHVDTSNRSRCPCRFCQNVYWKSLHEIKSHLCQHGISPSYDLWIFHGENAPRVADTIDSDVPHQSNAEGIDESLMEEEEEEDDDGDMNCVLEDYERAREFGDFNIDSLIGDAGTKLYSGCKFSTLEFIVQLMHLKVQNHWSQKSFDMLLTLLHQTWPQLTNIPNSTHAAKKRLRDVGLGYQPIHACRYDCSLYWGDKEKEQSCHVCHEPRYHLVNGKKVANYKVLRYFPITPRLQRLFLSRHTTKEMRWHKEKRNDTGDALRHPADGEAWKGFDETYPDFSADSRNVRLGLASDGFNPFGNMSHSYSMWPVLLIPYNLPPWKCMKEPFRMLSLLIPGPTSPGNEIDVYLQPLIDELKLLWVDGAKTYDYVSGQSFKMRAALLWTINDFPAYGNLSGWSTHGFMACPVCFDDTSYKRLISKTCYMGHRRLLCQT